jgi:hypothetical protein
MNEMMMIIIGNQIEGRIIVEEFGIVVGAAARSKNILHDLWGKILFPSFLRPFILQIKHMSWSVSFFYYYFSL